MSSTLKHCTVRFDPQKHERIIAIARERNCTPSDVIRSAVDGYLASNDLLSTSQRRVLRLIEFIQVAVDVMVREQFPEYRDRIVAEADKRLEQYHGA